MGASLGAGEKGSVNVELNIVPFIDLMSCLTAFLLVTAVWVNIAQINIQPKGKTRDNGTPEPEEIVRLSVLVQSDRIWIGLSRINEFKDPITKLPTGDFDWPKFASTLKDLKAGAYFIDRTDLEIAGESTAASPVKYQDIIRAMDEALKAGFSDVGLSDPAGLSARPTL